MYLAKPTKSSARRKNPRCVRARQVRRRRSPRARAAASVGSRRGSSPAMAIDPAAQANPSRMADLPEPFSPTRNVTGASKSSGVARSDATAGTANGYPSSSGCPERGGSRLTPRRWITPFPCEVQCPGTRSGSDKHVVGLAFVVAGSGDLDEFSPLMELGDGQCPGIAQPGADAGAEGFYEIGDRPAGGRHRFHTFDMEGIPLVL